jgi:hypothetical protein
VDGLQEQLRWDERLAELAIRSSVKDRLVEPREGLLRLTESGRSLARQSMVT